MGRDQIKDFRKALADNRESHHAHQKSDFQRNGEAVNAFDLDGFLDGDGDGGYNRFAVADAPSTISKLQERLQQQRGDAAEEATEDSRRII